MSKSLINSNLRRQVSNLVDSTESAIKITKLPNNNVKVNRRLVSKMRNLYTISDSKETFYLKKSAIGYALTLEDNNYGRTTLYNRISAIQPELETAREQLTKHLKSIKIA